MLRDYQFAIIQAIRDGHSEGDRNVIGVMPCRSGKTVCMSRLAAECDGPNIAMAHRQELIAQMSLTFARNEIPHRIVAPDTVIQGITALHHEQLGRSWWRPDAQTVVASVDSLKNADIDLSRMKLWQTDEAHHLITGNKWGRVIAEMPNAHGVGWTATPVRLDKKSLKRGRGGVFDRLVTGPSMRELIGRGYITDYRIYGVPNALNMDRVRVTGGGEFDKAAAHEEVKAARITGDLVKHYRRLADGMTAVTFAVDVELAHEHAQAFKDAGMPAAVIHAKTAGAERRDVIRAVKGGTLRHVVNVDILGEGVDFPACEVVIMARPTMSYGLYVQTFCRCLTPDATNPGKVAIVIDHVGNVVRHGLPDAYRTWTLDTPPKREAEKATIAIQVCGNEECMQVYESFQAECPFCGWERLREEGGGRERPEMVDGDLTLYGPELLAELRGEVQRIAGDACIPPHLDGRAAAGAKRQWDARREAQGDLSEEINKWAWYYHIVHKESIRTCYRRFYLTFGMDTLTAMSGSAKEQRIILERVRNDYTTNS
jgi:DNA repair protein RadD